MTTPLRYSARAEKWLHNFDSCDAAIAAQFLDSVILISTDQFQGGLFSVLRSASARSERPIAMFAARESSKVPYFHATDVSTRPNAVGDGAGVGSEGTIANLVRDFSRQQGPSMALDHPHIKCMRDTKVRRIIIVDDIIGSGQRAVKFIRYLSRHKTIKSWLSYGYVRFWVVAFAVTAQGRARLEAHPYVSNVIASRELESGRLIWPPEQRAAMNRLCVKYADRTSRPFWPLGFDAAMTMMVFEHKCPNTCPPILWAGSKKWEPLFDVRPQLAFDTWPENPGEADRLARALHMLGQKGLSEVQRMKYVSPEARLRFLILAAVAKRRTKLNVLCAIAEISIEACERLLRECQRFGWISPERRVTEHGLQELRYAREIALVDAARDLSLTDSVYVPQSFRGTSGSSSARQ